MPRALLTELMHMDADGSVGVQLRTQNATLLVGLTHPPPLGMGEQVGKRPAGLILHTTFMVFRMTVLDFLLMI